MQFWLTADEREENGVMAYIDRYAAMDKYKKVIYVSGANSLVDTMGDLLKRNRIVS